MTWPGGPAGRHRRATRPAASRAAAPRRGAARRARPGGRRAAECPPGADTVAAAAAGCCRGAVPCAAALPRWCWSCPLVLAAHRALAGGWPVPQPGAGPAAAVPRSGPGGARVSGARTGDRTVPVVAPVPVGVGVTVPVGLLTAGRWWPSPRARPGGRREFGRQVEIGVHVQLSGSWRPPAVLVFVEALGPVPAGSAAVEELDGAAGPADPPKATAELVAEEPAAAWAAGSPAAPAGGAPRRAPRRDGRDGPTRSASSGSPRRRRRSPQPRPTGSPRAWRHRPADRPKPPVGGSRRPDRHHRPRRFLRLPLRCHRRRRHCSRRRSPLRSRADGRSGRSAQAWAPARPAGD